MSDDLKQLLAAFDGELAEAADGISTMELAESMGVSDSTVRCYLRKAIKAGVIAHAGKRDSVRINGSSCKIDVYRRVQDE